MMIYFHFCIFNSLCAIVAHMDTRQAAEQCERAGGERSEGDGGQAHGEHNLRWQKVNDKDDDHQNWNNVCMCGTLRALWPDG